MFGNIFKKVKNKAVSALLASQLKNVPPEQRELIEALILENPELFEKISKEVEALKKGGMNEMYAATIVFKKYGPELAEIAKKYQKVERKRVGE